MNISYWIADNFGYTVLIGTATVSVIVCTLGLLTERQGERWRAKYKSKKCTGSPNSWRMFLK